MHMKKVFLVVAVIAFITCLTGIPYLLDGISARGWVGVNYGRVLFPLLICGVSFWQYQKKGV